MSSGNSATATATATAAGTTAGTTADTAADTPIPFVIYQGSLDLTLDEQGDVRVFGGPSREMYLRPINVPTIPDIIAVQTLMQEGCEGYNYLEFPGSTGGWIKTQIDPVAIYPVQDGTTNAERFDTFVKRLLDEGKMAIAGRLVLMPRLSVISYHLRQHRFFSLFVIEISDPLMKMIKMFGKKDEEIRKKDEEIRNLQENAVTCEARAAVVALTLGVEITNLQKELAQSTADTEKSHEEVRSV